MASFENSISPMLNSYKVLREPKDRNVETIKNVIKLSIIDIIRFLSFVVEKVIKSLWSEKSRLVVMVFRTFCDNLKNRSNVKL